MNNTWPKWINTQGHIGSQYPYYFLKNNNMLFNLEFDEIFKELDIDKPKLDVQSVAEILMRSFIIGDKTLVKGIRRSPWMAEYNFKSTSWDHYEIPPHNNLIMDEVEAAKKFKSLIYEETLNYIGTSKKVGILLSGGLDSRILAGVLREIELNNDFNGKIIVYNWGLSDSRDVWYAKKIADLFQWDYKHFPIDAETLKRNFYLVQKVGAETNPFNLHAMEDVSLDQDSEIILAGSYGDNLGRAIYNGRNIKNASPIVYSNANKLGLLKESVINDFYSKMEEESVSYRNTYDKHSREEYQYRETEYHRHQSRRYLTTAMSIIAMKKPLYQMLTSPKVTSFIWSLDLSIRTDVLYENILPMLPEKINEIPWANTGKVFGEKSEDDSKVDDGRKSYHKYGYWLRNDLRSFIDQELDINLLSNLGIFNDKALKKLYKEWTLSTGDGPNKLDTMISWLTAISMFIKKYDIENDFVYKKSTKDTLNSLLIGPKIKAYNFARNIIKK